MIKINVWEILSTDNGKTYICWTDIMKTIVRIDEFRIYEGVLEWWDGLKMQWEGKKYKSNILKYKKDYDGYHPTQKPVLLLEDLIKTFSNENETVLDFTCGSGSTLVACRNLNRNGIGIDNGICEKKGEHYGKSWIEVAQWRLDNE